MYNFFKRTFDIVLSLLAITLLVIPWGIIAVIIKLQSPGPIFFKPTRVGAESKTFTLYKFRTMCVDSGKIHSTTLNSDPRIFLFGKFLRKSKLDETPQFLNIIKGDMSIIGPRPEDEINAPQIFTGQFEDILSVKPGLSSPASLYDYTHGEKCRSEEEYNRYFLPQKLRLELYYVENRNFFYDIEIFIRTAFIIVATVFGKKNFKKPKETHKILDFEKEIKYEEESV